MCGRFAQGDMDAIYSKYRVKVPLRLRKRLKARYNIAPSQNVPIVRSDEKNKKVLEIMKWGLIPFWAEDPKIGNRMINARSETVSEKPSFRNSLRSRRCIVPSTGFYEWQKDGNGKIPYFIHPKDDVLFSLAGLFDIWKDPEGKEFASFTIITTDSSRKLKGIHDRMPVILENDEEKDWLDNKNTDSKKLSKLFDPYPDKLLDYYEVTKSVNNPINDSKEIIKPVKKN